MTLPRLLYRQRLAQFLPQLETAYLSANVENNAGPLLAMADIMHNVPKEVLASHLHLVRFHSKPC